MYKTIVALAVLCYNLIIVAGTAYLVSWQGWSGWWFALTILLFISFKDHDKEDCKCDSA